MTTKSTLDSATCARIAASALPSLAGLRRNEGITVLAVDDQAWVFWEPGEVAVLRALLPIPGVEFFERRGETWHRAGHRLPSFGLPPMGEPIALSRAVTPEPFVVEPPGPEADRRSTLRLARDTRPRPTSASLCPLAELVRWADHAPTAAIEALRGVHQGEYALIVGPNLPAWPGSTRYWGQRVLTPIGFEPRPRLPEAALLEALESTDRDLFRLIPEGDDALTVEAIPVELFRPLSRAGIRLAVGGSAR